MKPMICMIMALAVVFTLAACGTQEPPVVTTATETQTMVEIDEATAPEESTEAAVPETTEAPVTVYETVESALVDNEYAAFSVGAASSSELAGMALEVTCVNRTQEALVFSWSDVSVCGLMYDPGWAVTVPAGETLVSQVEIDTFALETMDIHAADEITFRLNVVSSENWMDAPYVTEYFTIYPTGLSAETVIYPVREDVVTQQVLVDDENMTFIIEYVEVLDLSYGVRCYIANKTDTTIMTNWENVTLNGQELDPFWTALVAPGKSAYAQVLFSLSDLEALGIEKVEKINFDLLAYRYDDWTELVRTTASYLPAEEAALG